MAQFTGSPVYDRALQGVWKVLWRRVNGQPPRRGGSLYLFGNYLLVHTHTDPFPFDYSVNLDASPRRLHLLNKINDKTQKAIYKLDGDQLTICETCQFLDATELDFPEHFCTVIGDHYTLTALERTQIDLASIDVDQLPELVAQHCGPAPKNRSEEEVKRLDAIRRSRRESAEKRLGKLASDIGEKYQGGDYAEAFLNLMTDDERLPVAVFWLFAEVNNGGFYQYLHNGTGALAMETLRQLNRIGARETASILAEALKQFPGATPASDTVTRRRQLEDFTLEQHEKLEQLTDRFYDQTDDTYAIAVDYLDSNPSK